MCSNGQASNPKAVEESWLLVFPEFPTFPVDLSRENHEVSVMRENGGFPVERLRLAATGLRDQYGIKQLSVFGSRRRGEGHEESDLDLLVEFDRPIGLLAFNQLEFELSELTGCRVDLVMRSALKPSLGARILADALSIS